MIKRIITLLLCLVLMASMMPVAQAAGEDLLKIYHIDCGRKYFSKEELMEIIDFAALYDYSHVQLAFGNNGLRFIPDDMALSFGGKGYDSQDVKKAIEEGNMQYCPSDSRALSQREMEELLSHAKRNGIEIIPLLNSPGHMNALLYAGEKLSGESLGYMGSKSTIDVENALAVEFAHAVLKKYAEFFAERGCRYFNIGADEYANDNFREGAMGFGKLISEGQYGLYADYVNSCAEIVKAEGMEPMAFNDGIYFAETRYCGGREIVFDKDIIVCYWQNGWGEYLTCPARTLDQEGFRIINTNNNWYYVLGKGEGGFGLDFARTGSREVPCDVVAGDYQGKVSPIGAMACLWCDDPSADYSEDEQKNVRELIRSLAVNNTGYFDFYLTKPSRKSIFIEK